MLSERRIVDEGGELAYCSLFLVSLSFYYFLKVLLLISEAYVSKTNDNFAQRWEGEMHEYNIGVGVCVCVCIVLKCEALARHQSVPFLSSRVSQHLLLVPLLGSPTPGLYIPGLWISDNQ